MPAFPVYILGVVLVPAEHAKRRALRAIARRLPPLSGPPIRVSRTRGLCDAHGPVHAGAFLRERRIEYDCAAREFPRIIAHEVFHFVWLRAGNPWRRQWEELLAEEFGAGARGELGWSAEWRKGELTAQDVTARSRRWREYCCESFADTAAWLYGGLPDHPEYTLADAPRALRRAWFATFVAGRRLPV